MALEIRIFGGIFAVFLVFTLRDARLPQSAFFRISAV